MHPPDYERLLTDQDVQRRYAIPLRFLQLSRRRGDGPKFVRIGRLVRYRHQDIADWIASQTREAG